MHPARPRRAGRMGSIGHRRSRPAPGQNVTTASLEHVVAPDSQTL
jgi:hypothetical protein